MNNRAVLFVQASVIPVFCLFCCSWMYFVFYVFYGNCDPFLRFGDFAFVFQTLKNKITCQN